MDPDLQQLGQVPVLVVRLGRVRADHYFGGMSSESDRKRIGKLTLSSRAGDVIVNGFFLPALGTGALEDSGHDT